MILDQMTRLVLIAAVAAAAVLALSALIASWAYVTRDPHEAVKQMCALLGGFWDRLREEREREREDEPKWRWEGPPSIEMRDTRGILLPPVPPERLPIQERFDRPTSYSTDVLRRVAELLDHPGDSYTIKNPEHLANDPDAPEHLRRLANAILDCQAADGIAGRITTVIVGEPERARAA